jgi:hypothetical protein
MVPWILRELRKWLQWRARRGLTHWWGVAEYTTVGTITARDDVCWKIEDDVGRPVYVRIDQFTVATTLQVGDRVEVQPIAQGWVIRGGRTGSGPPFGTGWMIVRKVEPSGEKPNV